MRPSRLYSQTPARWLSLVALVVAGGASTASCSFVARFDGFVRGECSRMEHWYWDNDGDGFGDPRSNLYACHPPLEAPARTPEQQGAAAPSAGWVNTGGDCDDDRAARHPDAMEYCDGVDSDCSSGLGSPERDPSEDADGDGFAPSAHVCVAMTLPKGDCDDARAGVNPRAAERCDGVDNNCDGAVDEQPAADTACTTDTNATGSCHAGACILECRPGYGDCDGDPANGCEVQLNTSHDCGACGASCGLVGQCRAGLCAGHVTAATAGYEHTCVLYGEDAQPGQVVCWGTNEFNQLGLADLRRDSRVPVAVEGLNRVSELVAGVDHTCGRVGAQVQCWGTNDHGQLGHSGADPRPAMVSGLDGVQQLAAADGATCARMASGQVQCWGDNRWGQLGINSMADSSVTPAPVLGMNEVVHVAMGGGGDASHASAHACAVKRNGEVFCWGGNAHGQLGTGDTVTARMPTRAVTGFPVGARATALALGIGHPCAQVAMGAAGTESRVFCWGDNSAGQLGIGSLSADAFAPRSAVLRFDRAELGGTDSLLASGLHSCAHRRGELLCWGEDRYGELGDGRLEDEPVAVDVANMPDATLVATGWYHTCAERISGQFACWGRNQEGQLGDGTNARRRVPTRVAGLTADARIVPGRTDACALRGDGRVMCWGDDEAITGPVEDLGFGVPQPVVGVNNAAQLAVGNTHACALTTGGAVLCWGRNDVGQLGRGTASETTGAPGLVAGLSDVTQLSTAGDFTCARKRDGSVLCWGSNASGQLGRSSTAMPVGVSPQVIAVTGALEVAAGEGHACARLRDGTVRCWGSSADGRLGSARTEDEVTTPTPVPGITNAIELTVGVSHGCVRTGDQHVMCWGDNTFGQLGVGDFVAHAQPAVVPELERAVRLASGEHFTCALLHELDIVCWGRNGFGQLGDGMTEDLPVPTIVEHMAEAVEITAGRSTACARARDGQLLCWGRNDYGQLGDGTDDDRHSPTEVRSLP